MSEEPKGVLQPLLGQVLTAYGRVLAEGLAHVRLEEVGIIAAVEEAVALVRGLPGAQSNELLEFASGALGVALNLDRSEVGVILLEESEALRAGQRVRRTGRVMDVPVGPALLGRVVDATGRPLDGQGPIHPTERWPVERESPGIMDRAPVAVPLQTGLKVIDALIPIGRGQRELILGDRQTGKTAVAVDTIINQHDQDVLCVYCAVGQRASAVARVIADLREHGAMDYSVVVVAGGEDPPGLRFIAPYAATSIGEYFRDEGRDVLIIYDDLTHHARAYRELSLLLRRPPGREAYPGDIFYIHSRMLERATHLSKERGDGSLTALPIAETEEQNVSAYIPTNLISITDGQILLSPELFQKGVLPAADVGKSVSRVGGEAQSPAYRKITSDLRLAYSQFEELEAFSRFGTQLEQQTRGRIRRGRRIREVLKQAQYGPIPVHEQIAVLLAATEGAFDQVPVGRVAEVEDELRRRVRQQRPELRQAIRSGKELDDQVRQALLELAHDATAALGVTGEGDQHGDD